jgi:hypothetical protein
MGLKLAMPQFSANKSEPSALAQTHARLKAWWNGDPAPKFETIAQDPSGENAAPSVVDTDAEATHTYACAALWGEDRTYPTSAHFESLLITDVGGEKASRLALFGGGAGGTAIQIGLNTSSKVEMFDQSPTVRKIVEKTFKAHKQGKRFGIHAFDWQPGSLPKGKADGAMFLFQGGAEGRIEAGAFCAERILRPGALVLWIDFFARNDSEDLDPCRGFEKRRFANEDEAIMALPAAGLDMRADDDWSARYLDAFDHAWRELASKLSVRQAALIKQGGLSAGSAALNDLMTWKARAEAVRSGKLTVRRYLAAK